jgi:ribose transport system permease protein
MTNVALGGLRKLTSIIWNRFSFVVIFIAIFVLYIVVSGGLSWNGIMNIPRHSAVVGLLALGMGLIILIGDIDLSVGSAMVMTAGFTVVVFNNTNSILLSLFFALSCGALCGFINGLLVGKAKMAAFIVTLSTMLIYRSISHYSMNEMKFTFYALDGALSKYPAFFKFGDGSFLTIPYIAIVFIAIALLTAFMSTSTKLGKKIYAVGSNAKAARLAGINVDMLKVLVFVLGGILTGLGAFLHIASQASATPASTALNYELYAIAGVVIGGISMTGGKGKILGIIFGVMTFTMIDKIIVALGLNALMNNSVKGIILLAAIALQMFRRAER